jgi:tetratricopeptide (TPR) repeat protein/tRNA A-37 threonylcarbamoyl transferase component Bud32
MSDTTCPDPDRHRRPLEEVIAGYEIDSRSGIAPTREAILAKHPDLREELTAFLAQQTGVDPAIERLRIGRANVGSADATGSGATMSFDSTKEDTAATERLPDHALLRQFGDYELFEVLGRGGMGVVYKARQVSLNRPVALKMIRDAAFASDEERQRFQNEAEAVALLDHPGIVPIYEVGEFEGHRYFSMKLISGGSLSRRLAEFFDDPKKTAAFVAGVADVVHHAHARGILHRDLKPANVLIDDSGNPNLTDFGLAKRVEGDSEMTASGAILGTPAYMAPEQAIGKRGMITTATDVHGLGTILYALLTGHAPFVGDSVAETLTKVRERAPEPPRTLNQNVPRDLEVICQKCLEKDPRRRYPTAQALADDLRRFLADEPITARPVGQTERTWMWCRRNPIPAGLAAALVAAMTVGFAVVTWKWSEAERQQGLLARSRDETVVERDKKEKQRALAVAAERRALEQAERVAVINGFLIQDLLVQAEPEYNAAESRVTLRQILDRAATKVGTRFPGRPDLEAEIRTAIGQTYHGLGAHARSEEQFRAVTELRRKSLGPEAPETFEAISKLAHALDHLGRSREAEPMAKAALEGLQRTRSTNDDAVILALNNFAVSVERAGRSKDAIELLQEGLRRKPGESHLTMNLAVSLGQHGERPEAARLLRQLLEDNRRLHGDEHPATLAVGLNLALVLKQSGKLKEAEELYRKVTDSSVRVLGEDHLGTLITMDNLAGLLEARGDLSGALELRTRVLAGLEQHYGADHTDTLQCLNNLGLLHRQLGNPDEAIKLLGRAVEGERRLHGDDHLQTLVAMDNLASLLNDRDRLDEAESMRRKAVEGLRRSLGFGHADTQIAAHNLVELLAKRTRIVEAERLSEEALDGLVKLRGYDHPDTQHMLVHRIEFLTRLGRASEAEALKLRLAPGRATPHETDAAASIHRRAHDLLKAGRPAEAEPLFRSALETYARQQGPDGDLTLDLTGDLASALSARGNHAEAEHLQRRAIDGFRRKGNNLGVILNSIGLASSLQTLGRAPEALAPLREGLTIQGRTQSVPRPIRGNLLVMLGSILIELNRASEAEAPLREAITIRAQELPQGHWQIASAQGLLASCLLRAGRLDEAEPMVRSSLQTLRADRHAPRRRLLEMLNVAIAYAERRGRPEEAARLRIERLDAAFPDRVFAEGG